MSSIIKNIVFICTISVCFSCDKTINDVDPTFECDEMALQSLEGISGTMLFLGCYDSWAVLLNESIHPDGNTVLVSLDINPNYHVEGLNVTIDACLYEFDLPLLLPDPVIWGYLYRMENFDLSID